MMLDHVIITVTDYERSKEFYEKALKPLGYGLMEFESGSGGAFGPEGKPVFAIRQGEPHPVHIAFNSPDRATVDAFYEAATAAGGKDNGPPGLRPHYHEHYYGAFVHDPDGYNVEAVCHAPEP